MKMLTVTSEPSASCAGDTPTMITGPSLLATTPISRWAASWSTFPLTSGSMSAT